MCVVCVCVRACVRACARACACVSMSVSVSVCLSVCLLVTAVSLTKTAEQDMEPVFPQGKKGKVFPYSLPSVGPGADPSVQAVSPQVT